MVAALFVLWVARALYVVLRSRPASFPMDVEKDLWTHRAWQLATPSPGIPPAPVLAGPGVPVFLLVAAYAGAPTIRAQGTWRQPRRSCRRQGSIIGEVVGRDELCQVMIDDPAGPWHPASTWSVIGGVRTGKTALLVRLTKLLAEQGAVPGAGSAAGRPGADSTSVSWPACGSWPRRTPSSCPMPREKKVWRQLCKDDRVVVLADGLEEALIEGEVEKERDTPCPPCGASGQ